MELKEYITMELEGLKRGIDRVFNGLTQAEMQWRPACGCNSIGLIFFHVAKSEDAFIQEVVQGKPQLWSAGKWYEKLHMSEKESGAHYTIDQVNTFPVPDVKDVFAYYDAVRNQTMNYLKTLNPADFEKKFKLPFGEFSLAGIFSIIVSHTAQHVGEISYLRGLQRGMDK
jgi:DinB superfamily